MWRIKWKSFLSPNSDSERSEAKSYLALACMHGGSAIYQVNCSSGSADVVSVQQDSSNPERLVYGMDWLELKNTPEVADQKCDHQCEISWKVATCSFYDNAVQIWQNH